MDARRDLIGEDPLIAQISETDTDKTDTNNDTYIPMHPGATAYFGGNVQSFFDKYGDQLFYGSMLLGTLTSLFAAGWKFMTKGEDKPDDRPLMRLYALTEQISKAGNEAELAETEQRIDDILKGELEKYVAGDADATESAALGLATHRLGVRAGTHRGNFYCIGKLDCGRSNFDCRRANRRRYCDAAAAAVGFRHLHGCNRLVNFWPNDKHCSGARGFCARTDHVPSHHRGGPALSEYWVYFRGIVLFCGASRA